MYNQRISSSSNGITTRYQLAWGGEYEDVTLVQNSLASALSGGFFNDDTDHYLTVWKGQVAFNYPVNDAISNYWYDCVTVVY